MSKTVPSPHKYNVTVDVEVEMVEGRDDVIAFQITTVDGSTLTAQQVIDAVAEIVMVELPAGQASRPHGRALDS